MNEPTPQPDSGKQPATENHTTGESHTQPPTHPRQKKQRTPLWRHPVLFPIVATAALIAIILGIMPPSLHDFETMSLTQRVKYLERFTDSTTDSSADVPSMLLTAKYDNPKIIIAAAAAPHPDVREAGLKALANLMILTRSATDFGDKEMPALSDSMQADIDQIALTGISNPQGEHFELYLNILEQLATEGDKYHLAVLSALPLADTETQALIWLRMSYALGPRHEAQDFILETLQSDAPLQARRLSIILCLYLLDESFIEPLTSIAVDTKEDPTLRGIALRALADYGAKAQHVLPQLRPLLDDPDLTEANPRTVARSITTIEEDTPKRYMQNLHPTGGPWRNINPLW